MNATHPSSTEPSPATAARIDPVWIGTACCLLSALGYTAANICLRQSAAMEIDPAWVICIKEAVAVAVVGPWLLLQLLRGRRFALPARALAVLVVAGLGVQLLGNLNLQWALGVVGLAISMPVVFGAMLIGSALIGLLVFRETLPPRSALAVALVMVSIAFLGTGAARAEGSQGALPAAGVPLVLLGIAAAGLCGITFATLGAAIRYSAGARVPVIVTVLVVTGMGFVSLSAVTLVRLGPEQMLQTDPAALAWMVASGVFNLLAFALIIKGLQLTTLVHANVLNVSQAALGAVAGMVLFREPHNPWLLAGIGLTLVGIAIFRPPAAAALRRAGKPVEPRTARGAVDDDMEAGNR